MSKILLVDDDSEDRSIITDALNHFGTADIVSSAENGEAALKLLSDFALGGTFPSLIVLDLNMPRMNGAETLKHLKNDARFKNIPVVIYSTSINPLEKEVCINLGAQLYITKPVSYQESLDTARLFLKLSGVENVA